MKTAVLGVAGSELAERVAARSSLPCLQISADSARARVRVRGASVRWNEVALDELSALVVEAPWIPWPQPITVPQAGETAELVQRRGIAARERRALHVSALRIAARRVPTANDPTVAADLAMASALALERLAQAGVAVREWSVTQRPRSELGLNLQLIAEDGPRAWTRGAALCVDADPARTTSHLAVGEKWIASCAGGAAAPTDLRFEAAGADRELALKALEALGLVFACVHVCEGAVAFVDSAANLRAWEHASDGRVSAALAEWLARASRTRTQTH